MLILYWVMDEYYRKQVSFAYQRDLLWYKEVVMPPFWTFSPIATTRYGNPAAPIIMQRDTHGPSLSFFFLLNGGEEDAYGHVDYWKFDWNVDGHIHPSLRKKHKDGHHDSHHHDDHGHEKHDDNKQPCRYKNTALKKKSFCCCYNIELGVVNVTNRFTKKKQNKTKQNNYYSQPCDAEFDFELFFEGTKNKGHLFLTF
ncbi:hypothetical protein RFI_14705 [Reticulomyxa filosa]|uniref:Uncharacterized protein n=1 Tax=Reticulomyxa filosa TaxID=46433 RepID=X6N890_RETFI|nr:hypothetical protein RFI_14705 [Reticulomyxa filosa]|eukprot:ETO22490.1 hypothetical protein RFI_14705 [Reticulomyxa filosa]